MKSKRHKKILELISDFSIETQEDLQKRLTENGFFVTQATVSRDIKELRLIKVQSGSGKYQYSVTFKEDNADMSLKFHSIFIQSVISIDFAGNIVVIKCYTGMANAACASLDSIHWSGVVGTLAGDDTIFIVMRDSKNASEFVTHISKLLEKK